MAWHARASCRRGATIRSARAPDDRLVSSRRARFRNLGTAFRVLTAAAALSCALVAGACKPDSHSGDYITFNMSWLPQGSMAGVIVAIDKGYYAQEGLNVSVMRGFGGIRTVNELDHGLFDFGYVDPIAIALNRAHGGKARMVGAINARWPGALCYIKERHHIEKPADLVGLTIGGGQNSAMQAILPIWLQRNGLAPQRAKILQLDPAVIVNSLVRGQIDAAECWEGASLPLVEKQTRAAGLTLGWLPYRNFGFDIYGSGVATTDEFIAHNPDTVRKFLKATYRGYAEAGAHPDDAVATMTSHFPTLDPAITRRQLDQTLALMHDDEPVGSIRANKMAAVIDFLHAAKDLKSNVSAADLFTNRFLPADDRRKQ